MGLWIDVRVDVFVCVDGWMGERIKGWLDGLFIEVHEWMDVWIIIEYVQLLTGSVHNKL